MTGWIRNLILGAVLLGLSACGGEEQKDAAAQADKPVVNKASLAEVNDNSRTPAKAGAPIWFKYKTIGTPVVGSPVTLELEVYSVFADTPVEIGYQIADPSALRLHEAQPKSLVARFARKEDHVAERVTVIPQRTGRLYLNVSAAVTTGEGRTSVVTAIPIHVGVVDTAPVEHGELETNEEGETTRVLTSE